VGVEPTTYALRARRLLPHNALTSTGRTPPRAQRTTATSANTIRVPRHAQSCSRCQAVIQLVWADGGYAGGLVTWAARVIRLSVTVVKRSDDTKGFAVLPRRWVVERTLARLTRNRRLVRDYERRADTHEAMTTIAMIALMSRRLARAA